MAAGNRELHAAAPWFAFGWTVKRTSGRVSGPHKAFSAICVQRDTRGRRFLGCFRECFFDIADSRA